MEGIEENIRDYKGARELLRCDKTAFLCSRKVPPSIVLKCYDWAIGQRDAGHCIISGFHSQIEKDVLHYLLKGEQPIVITLARGIMERTDPILAAEIEKGRLLMITPFDATVTRVSQHTANKRNNLIAGLADEIFVPYAQEGGNVGNVIFGWLKKGKIVKTLDVQENRALIDAGAVTIG